MEPTPPDRGWDRAQVLQMIGGLVLLLSGVALLGKWLTGGGTQPASDGWHLFLGVVCILLGSLKILATVMVARGK